MTIGLLRNGQPFFNIVHTLFTIHIQSAASKRQLTNGNSPIGFTDRRHANEGLRIFIPG